jgi:hypothetical protein
MLTVLIKQIGVKSDYTNNDAPSFVESDEGHRAGVIELRQFREEFVFEFLDRIEKSKSQVFLADAL